MAYKTQNIRPVALLIGGPYDGQNREVSGQKYMAWTRKAGGGWEWIIYQHSKDLGPKLSEYEYVGSVTDTQPEFEYDGGEIRWS